VELLAGRRLAVLTGAGCSTESGIPDYRGPETRRRARNPIRFAAYMQSEATRRRYWARSVVGWERFRLARPNPAHRALAELEHTGRACGVITQNVDRLHQSAGGSRVIELHGALAEVRCLECGHLEDRDVLQHRLLTLNPGWHERHAELAPDGDAELPSELVDSFRTTGCERCDGTLKPNVVFFGENVARPVVESAFELLSEADGLLVVGTSLAVFSGLRFVRRAAEQGIPIAIVNLGPTRGDPYAAVKVEVAAGQVLPALATVLTS
jgi:NAD-dependent SIR2 family protein deacetylase